MSYARQMLDTYPRTFNVDADLLAAAIDALDDCAQACNADNTADLSEQNVVEMVTCIRLCLDCVDVCTATSRALPLERLRERFPARAHLPRPGKHEAPVRSAGRSSPPWRDRTRPA